MTMTFSFAVIIPRKGYRTPVVYWVDSLTLAERRASDLSREYPDEMIDIREVVGYSEEVDAGRLLASYCNGIR